MPKDNILEEIYKHAEKSSPEESCGILVKVQGETQFIPCTNVSDNPEHTFAIGPSDYAKAEDLGTIEVIVHSHVLGSSKPSAADKASCNLSKVPWLIVSVPNRSETFILPEVVELPYEGRPFFHGVLDCYTIIKDYYKRELNIELLNYYRVDKWWDKGENKYLDLAEGAGFGIITSEKPKIHDIIVMQVGASVPNHGAIYLGNNIILHHVANRESCKAVYGGFWEKNTWGLLRHQSLM